MVRYVLNAVLNVYKLYKLGNLRTTYISVLATFNRGAHVGHQQCQSYREPSTPRGWRCRCYDGLNGKALRSNDRHLFHHHPLQHHHHCFIPPSPPGDWANATHHQIIATPPTHTAPPPHHGAMTASRFTAAPASSCPHTSFCCRRSRRHPRTPPPHPA